MSILSRAVAVMVLGLVGAGVPAAQAGTSGPSANACTLSAHVTLSPGISMTPTVGTIATHAPGTMTCTGVVNGATVTGPGPVVIKGTYGTGATLALQGGDTCVQGSGSAIVTASIPTTAGTQKITLYVETLALGNAGAAAGISPDGTRNGALFQFSPDRGEDCTTVPVTGIAVSSQALNIRSAG